MGSFGTVCKAKLDDFVCAAKSLINTAPSRDGRDSAASLAQKFLEECDFLSTLRHPNIVQYLGVCEDPDSRQPLLLMELMNDENLTQFLDNSPSLLPFHVEVNICQDLAQALAYLHSNKVVHRDLSGSNVLLMGNALKAKVCDFGTARLLDLTPSYRQTLTMCPGNAAYMPPEALRDNPKYDEKLDCFSFGVLVLQVLTRLFPQPGDRNKPIEDGRYSGTVLMMLVPEVERRQDHIGLIDPEDPLLRIALECLKDESFKRPSAQQLCESLRVLKESERYRESETLGNRAGQDIPNEHSPRPHFPSLPVSVVRARAERLERCKKCDEKSSEIIALKGQIKQNASLLEDAFMNASVQESFLTDTKAKLEAERQVSVKLRHQVTQGQTDMKQLQQELFRHQNVCATLRQQCESEQRQRYESENKLERLRYEFVQNQSFVSSLQNQLQALQQSEWLVQQELSQVRDELSRCEQDRLRVRREMDEELQELSRERNGLSFHLREMSGEVERVRHNLDSAVRERATATEERDRLIREVRELQRRLADGNTNTQEQHTTTTQILIRLEDGWNIPRGEVDILGEREIGRGATGLVREGRYQNLPVAVKQIHPNILENDRVVEEFRREIGIMASVKHPNLVRFIAAVFDDAVEQLLDTPLLVLELLHTNLRKAYERGAVETSHVKISIFRDVAYGLHYLHEHNEPIIHRDVSAPNVLLELLPGDMWRAKLSDFGSANFAKRAQTLGVGAIIYTAPEMFPREGPRTPMARLTTKCDVFSYGIVLVEVITKTMPTRENRHQMFGEVETKWPLVFELASRCTETVPEARPTMAYVLNMLNRIPVARPRGRSLPPVS